jgi:asparagine synthase (glutamine-hydrolysing)
MDFIFGCWSDRHSSVDCRGIAARMAAFFQRQNVAYALFPFDPHFAAGVASFLTGGSRLSSRALETPEAMAVGDVTLYGPPDAADGAARSPLSELVAARGDEPRLARLNGDFAAAIADRSTGRLTLIRDHCGVMPLFYSQHGAACAFSSLVRPLLEAPWATPQLDEVALATYLLMMAPGRERTYYTCAKAVLPASRVVLDGSASAASRKYWLPHPTPGLKLRSAGEAYEAVRAELVRAVVSRAKDAGGLGIKLSGGLDSSTIAGILCSTFPERTIQAVSGALPPGSTNPKGDERAYIEETKRLYPNLRVTYETAEGVGALEDAEYWATWLASPVANEYWYLESSLLRRAREAGTRYLFSGFGGDQCVSNKGHCFMAECILGLRPLLFVQEFRRLAKKEALSFVGVLRHKVAPVVLPRAIRRWLGTWRRGPWHNDYALAPSWAGREDLKGHLTACGFFGDSPRRFAENERGRIASFDVIGPAPENTAAAPFGLTMRFPLLDPRLLEVVLATPWPFKVSDRHDRMLIRGAARPFLPRIIAERTDKGYVSPDFEDRLRAAKQELRRTLLGSTPSTLLKGLADTAKIHRALELLQVPDSARREPRLIWAVVLPFRLAQFDQIQSQLGALRGESRASSSNSLQNGAWL